MSFVKALAAVAVGFAAAKGMDKYKKMGGMAGLQDAMQGAGNSNIADQLGRMADQFGIPGGSAQVKSLFGQMGQATAGATEAGAAGLGGLMASMRGAAEAGSQQSAAMMDAMFGNTPVGDAMEQQAKLMIRAMIQAAKADGEIDEEEQAAIVDRLGDISEEEREFVKAELQAPVDLPSLIQEAGTVGREQIYSTSLAAIRIDNPAEAQYMRQLATGLGLTDEQRDAIHARMGVAAPS
ncbi:tellurite resistance TerB family protein [Roseobacter sinensis]|uniref:Tellurite resistance TerB family protein n=1 Tax=Roseobacter sinensis TaxID=2931391 RepID=A0ABT3BCH1_9RHOB|nr:tellurite resistance TerB family protein [Roseobacter sp. WL0113]MCV3271275.1 tellurite resistance TerB family protein [Roseobacter sp. WL0113]